MGARHKRPVVLVVLDGWGYREGREGNAIALAQVPNWERLWARAPRTLLHASGRAVGLPEGQMGNSEVGHLNLGAGRVVMQDLVRIGEAIRDGSFAQNPALVAACERVKKSGGTLHCIGLIGDGGVHAHDAHLLALVRLATERGVAKIAVHAFLDGRDTLPRSALGYLTLLQRQLGNRAQIASVCGRYYAMDRDQRWARTELAYRAMVEGTGPAAVSPLASIQAGYDAGITDEFQKPAAIVRDGVPVAPMRDGDQVIGFNYRSDRMRQIVRSLVEPGFAGFDVSKRPRVGVTTMTVYDSTFRLPVAFAAQSMAHIVGHVVSDAGLTMFRTAETE